MEKYLELKQAFNELCQYHLYNEMNLQLVENLQSELTKLFYRYDVSTNLEFRVNIKENSIIGISGLSPIDQFVIDWLFSNDEIKVENLDNIKNRIVLTKPKEYIFRYEDEINYLNMTISIICYLNDIRIGSINYGKGNITDPVFTYDRYIFEGYFGMCVESNDIDNIKKQIERNITNFAQFLNK